MARRGENQAGLALVGVLAVVFVLTVLSALVLYLSGKEVGLSALRARGAEAMTIAEGGAYAARSALMAVMNTGAATPTVRVDTSLNGPVLETLWAGGRPGDQNPLRILSFLIVDGQRLDVPATSDTDWAVFPLDWGLATPHLKLRMPPQTGSGAPPADPQRVASPPANPLGAGSYRATVLLLPVAENSRRRRDGKWTCSGEVDPPGEPCFVHQLSPEAGQEEYEFFFEYRVFSDGQAASQFRRRVTLAGRFSITVRRENFAKYALFTHAHTMPGGDGGPLGTPIWFT
ncbi:MAG: pilus assembly PilX N-terminal domain-containing protein, partial [Armatimonadota bacterium]|nr:pilus assembly PilX N-terminal domain-containing protein [Armatimonadota bacterium]